jgi:phage shock protein E
MGNSGSNSINSQEAKKLINDKFFDVILDVRTDTEWNEGHHPNAVHIPLDKVDKKFISKYQDKNLKILVYCKSGVRAANAGQILNSQGYSNVYSVSGGGYNNLL